VAVSFRNHKSSQEIGLAVFHVRNDDGRLERRERHEITLDIPELNPVTMQLDLVIPRPSKKATLKEMTLVAGAVGALSF